MSTTPILVPQGRPAPRPDTSVEGGDQLSTLDFLRTGCVIIVVGVHLLGLWGHGGDPAAKIGRMAVVLFFVHTSFVLMLSLERQWRQNPHDLWRRFMVRRIFRIYPLTLVVLSLIVAFKIPSRMIPPGFVFVELALPHLVSNFLLAMNLTRSPLLLTPLWSLPYELQMYPFLPDLFTLSGRWRSAKPWLWLWLMAAAVAMIQPHIPHAGRLDVIQFFPCFLPGILSYKLSNMVRPRLSFATWPGVFLLLVGLILLAPTGNWPCAWLICLLAGLTVPFVREARAPLVRKTCHWIAQHSYSIYLSHYGCIWLAFRANRLPEPMQWTIFAACLVLIPLALYRCIEEPMNQLGRRLSVSVVSDHTAGALNHSKSAPSSLGY